MKRALKIILLGLLVITFAACGKKEEPAKESEASASSEVNQAAAQAAIAKVKYPGEWVNDISSRMIMKITSAGDNTYEIDVDYGQTNDESTYWTMTAKFNPETNRLEYSDGKYGDRYHEPDGNVKEEAYYENGTGELWVDNSGKLFWKSNMSDQDYLTDEQTFSKGEEE